MVTGMQQFLYVFAILCYSPANVIVSDACHTKNARGYTKGRGLGLHIGGQNSVFHGVKAVNCGINVSMQTLVGVLKQLLQYTCRCAFVSVLLNVTIFELEWLQSCMRQNDKLLLCSPIILMIKQCFEYSLTTALLCQKQHRICPYTFMHVYNYVLVSVCVCVHIEG